LTFKDQTDNADDNLSGWWNILDSCLYFHNTKRFKDKTYGMPLIALCANISWEFIFSFVFPHTPPQLFINYLWFGLDSIIVIQFFKYGKNEFLNLSSKKLYSIFVVLLGIKFSIILFSGITLWGSKGFTLLLDKIL